jgi:hypothetical protein
VICERRYLTAESQPQIPVNDHKENRRCSTRGHPDVRRGKVIQPGFWRLQKLGALVRPNHNLSPLLGAQTERRGGPRALSLALLIVVQKRKGGLARESWCGRLPAPVITMEGIGLSEAF